MAVDIAINLRSTSGFVTDPAGSTYCLNEVYPVTRNLWTFGWVTTAPAMVNRSSGVDARLAGIATTGVGTPRTLRIDGLTAGTVTLHLAMGDATTLRGATMKAEVLDSDGSTVLSTPINTNGFAAGQFLDATNVPRTSASDWVTNEQPSSTVTITGTSIYVRFGNGGTAGTACFNHVRVVQGGATGGPFPHFTRRNLTGGLNTMSSGYMGG